ncbi:hypothetical protein JYG23_06000 [Sedimentibacter sp. zth1]|uniref:hypothetical protein n=1 Tax=Sedimentibacter sp. zth1 TaxID=2816908 RepID=UPI001A92F188|nr:hypothetical protein [Sedimentibacter sp. zth1]QSX06941.1 hypothetical protein JYG23_06000 [Sedimentibacter sp. zth1]
MKKVFILAMAIMLVVIGTVSASAATSEKEGKVLNSKAEYAQEFAAQAEEKGMTVEEYKQALADSKKDAKPKMTKEEFEAQLAAKGMTVEEYKALVSEKFAAQAEEKGMTVEEYKQALADSKK